MRKKRILLCGEYSGLNSGYANWSRNILTHLHFTNKYELAELACFCSINDLKDKKSKWKIYPNSVAFNDERYESYKSSVNNTYGQWRFDAICLDFKPDIVIDFRDPWMFEYQSYSAVRRFFKWIIMPPVDSVPQKNEWITIFNHADLIIPYTNWAKKALEKYKHLKVFHTPSPAGVDSSVFKPISVNKKEYGLPENKFVIGSVMRNQRRKLIPALFELLSIIEDSILYLHTTYPELNGWNIPALLLDYKVFDRVFFTYKCRACNKHYCSNYVGANSQCRFCSKPMASLSTTSSGITDPDLAKIYNLFDVYVQYAVCEGFGMPQIEASACGIPIFSVDYSAMSEVARAVGGFPIPLANTQKELESGADRAYPNIDATKNLILDYQKKDETYKSQLKQQTRLATIKNYSWKDIGSVWEEAIDSMNILDLAKWDEYPKYSIPNTIPNYSLNNYDFISNICCDILQEPLLMKTQMIQHILYSLDHGVTKNGGIVKTYNKKDAASHLEQFAKHKSRIDEIRTHHGKIKEDYI